MKKTKLVTSLYTDISGPPFYGHGDKAREDRYFHSLRTLCHIESEIVLYCNETQKEQINDYLSKFKLNNVILKISNLIDFPYSQAMIDIKNKTNNFRTYHEVDWNKLFLLQKELDESYDYIYWIDVGLSHPGLFLDKYNPYIDKADGMSATWENYSYINLFSPDLLNKLNNFTGQKLINLATTQLFHDMNFAAFILDIPFESTYHTIGGILGGHTNQIGWFIENFNLLAQKLIDKQTIINHEAIITFLTQTHPELFETFLFDTWYHDDYYKKTTYFDVSTIKNSVHFVHFFEKILKI